MGGVLRRGGRIVQVGMLPAGTAPVPVNVLQSREIELVGAEAVTALELAGDRSKVVKLHLALNS